MNGLEVLLPHIYWLIGIILAGGIVGGIAGYKGATKRSADAYRWLTSAILLVVYMLVKF